MSSYPRARIAAAAVVAFVCGLVFASSIDLTRFSWAQQTTQPPLTAEVQPLADLQSSFEAIADRVTPAVVSIQIERTRQTRPAARQRQQQPQLPPGMEEFFRDFMPDPGPMQGTGSGVIVSRDGYILTNNHVIEDADKVTVGLLDKRQFEARIVGRDPTTDVAVIKIEGQNLPYAQLGDDNRSRVGQWVLAIGNPMQLDFTVTAGIISAKGRPVRGLFQTSYAITDFIQTDAAINPGNSGGPLVNIRGEVIGINTAIASPTGVNAGYGFAIPITLAKQVMDDLIEHGRVRRAVLGVQIDEVSQNDARAAGLREIRGAKVQGFTGDDSPARRGGLEVGDIIIGAGGQPVDRVGTLQRIIRAYKPGQTVDVEVQRFGDRRRLQVRLGEPPNEQPTDIAAVPGPGRGARPTAGTARTFDKLGISAQPVPPAQGADALPREYQQGLLVTEVNAQGPAYRLLAADRHVIVRVRHPVQRDVRSPQDLEQALSQVRSGDLVTLIVWDRIQRTTAAVTLPVK